MNEYDYIITANDTYAHAVSDRATLPIIDGIAGDVLQKAINNLCPPGSEKYKGGGQILLLGSFNMWGKALTINNWNKNLDDPGGTITIDGNGCTVLLFNGLAVGQHAITISNGLNVRIRDMAIIQNQPTAGSAIRVEQSPAQPIAARKGIFHDLDVFSASTTDYAFYAENFFEFDMQRVKVRCPANGMGSLMLYNNSTTTCFGNSKFQNMTLLAPDRNDGAALKIGAINNAFPMNLNSFDTINIGTNRYAPGQTHGIGIWIEGGANTVFNHIDVEYMPTSLHLPAARRVEFLSGYIHPDGKNAQGIYCGAGTNGCKFNLEVACDDVSTVIAEDTGSYKEPNCYNLSLSGAADPSKITVPAGACNTVTLRLNGSDIQRNRLPHLTITGNLQLPAGNNNPVEGNMWIESGKLYVMIGGVKKIVSLKW